MVDSQRLVHVPGWVRAAALVLLLVTFSAATYVMVHFVHKDDPTKFADWILVGMSLVHLALSGLAVALVLFFSEREASAQTLRLKALRIQLEDFPQILVKVTAAYELRAQASTVTRLGPSDIFGSAYEVASGEHRIKVWLGLNVTRLFAIFWVAVPEDEPDAAKFNERLRQIYEFTFGGAQRVGYHTYFESVTVENTRIISIWSSVDTEHNLLLEPSRRVFWLQDIAMMIESFWRTSIRHGLSTARQDPSPL
jgi:hypothetical protein